MKTRFIINEEVFGFESDISLCEGYFERRFKSEGFVFDKEAQDCYKDFDQEIQLNEGDRVDLSGFRIVDWKCVDLDRNLIIYNLVEE